MHMKHFSIFTVMVAVLLLGASVHAQESNTLSARSGSGGGARFFSNNPTFRVDDKGRRIDSWTAWRKQVVYRATNDTFVNRTEGRATAREEESSPVMIFHFSNGEVKGGHVYQRRDN